MHYLSLNLEWLHVELMGAIAIDVLSVLDCHFLLLTCLWNIFLLKILKPVQLVCFVLVIVQHWW